MTIFDCRTFCTPAVLLVTLILLVCGCEPEVEVGTTTDAAPAEIVAPEPSTSDAPAPSTASVEVAAPVEAVAPDPQNVDEGLANEDPEVVSAAGTGKTFEAKFFCWNIESEGSDPEVIARQLTEMGRYDIYALTEFLPSAKTLFEETLGADFKLIISRSGYRDRLAIAFDTRRFDLIKSFEIEKINYKNRYRSPLVVHLKDKQSETEFFVMNNHLARGREGVRLIQTKQLVAWARTQLLPVVALGDYNLDYVFATKKGNSGFASMLHDNVWKWVKPVEMIDTNWYDNPEDPDGQDDYPGSMLDFAFVSGPAKAWEATCKIIVRPGDFPDDDKTSDHRPFELLIAK